VRLTFSSVEHPIRTSISSVSTGTIRFPIEDDFFFLLFDFESLLILNLDLWVGMIRRRRRRRSFEKKMKISVFFFKIETELFEIDV
jgi:hypothetical protein